MRHRKESVVILFVFAALFAGANRVAVAQPTLSVNPSTVQAGGSVTATWSGIATPTATDWIGLYASGAGNGSYLTWIYVSCTQTPGSPLAAGSCPFTIPAGTAAGSYQLRLFANNGYTLLATSNSLTVTATGGTNVSGTISTSTTWTLAGSPYIVTGDVYVEKNGTPTPVLTIQPGVTVQVIAGVNFRVGYNFAGSLQAIGTASQPITFTANTGSPTPGYWRGLQIGASAVSTQMSYVTVGYGGYGYTGGVHVLGSSPTLSNLTVQNNVYAGISVNGGSPTISSLTATGNPWGMVLWGTGTPSVSGATISNNTAGGIYLASPISPSLQAVTVSSNTGYAMSQDAATTLGTVSGITATGNTTDGMEVRGSTASVNTTWRNLGIPYVATYDIYVEKNGAPAPVLTIEAGVTVKFNANTNLFVGLNFAGGLQAVGASASPITFTANTATPAAGFWRGIDFGSNTVAPSQIAYATVSYGGYYNRGGIHALNCSPTLSNLTLRNNSYSGISVNGGSPAISSVTATGNQWGMVLYGTGSPSVSGATISSNTSGGIYLASPAVVSLQTVSITNNTGFAMSQDAGTTLGTVSGITATGNTTDGVEIRASTANINTTWQSFGLPYFATGDVYVEKNGTPAPVLTIQPGVTVKFNANTSLFVGLNFAGGLQAVGASASPITFTANTATPAAGFWRGIDFGSNTVAPSQIAYATVSYGGYFNRGGIHASSCSPTLSNLTLQNNTYSGISVNGGSPTISSVTASGNQWGMVLYGTGSPSITSATLSSNTAGGIYLAAPISPTFQTVTISGNTGYAMSQDPPTSLGTVSGITATGNTINAVEVRSSATRVTATWRNLGIPYVLTGNVYVQSTNATPAILTIEAGATVKFNSGTTLYVGYDGSSNPYLGGLQAVGTAASPIIFTANTASPAAGFYRGIYFGSYALSTSQVVYATVSYGGYTGGNNQGGIHALGCSPTISNVTFQNNAYAGMSVNGGSPMVVSSSFIGNPAGILNFTPIFIVNARLNYWSSSNGPSGIGPGTGQSVTNGVLFDPWLTGAPAASEYFSSATTANRRFNPSTANRASWNLGASLSSNWTFTISNSSNVVVRTATFSGPSLAFTWDGKNDSGILQPDGTYTYVVQANSGSNPATPASGLAYVDSTLQVAITAPGATDFLSNVYANGVGDVAVMGSAAMANLVSWTLDYAVGSSPSPTSFTTIATSTHGVTNTTLGTWATTPLANSLYTLRLSVSDNQTNVIQAIVTPTVGNFTVSESTLQLSAPAGNTVTYSSVVPFALTETVTVKNAAGQIVRTLVNTVQRSAATYNDVWNGKNDSAGFLPDGPYFYFATVTDGTHSMTWDLTNQYLNDGSTYGVTLGSPFDPFNNKPLSISYSFAFASRVSLGFYPYPLDSGCNPPAFCLPQDQYTEAGPHTVYWAGVDPTGAYSTSTIKVAAYASRALFSKNAIVLFGTKPSVTNVAVTPPMYGPLNGTQTVSFSLASFQNQPAAVAVTFLNQASLSVLRTISIPSQSPGSATVVWDGHADNGMLVAPGSYTVTVTATDSLGNVATGQILTTVQY